MQTMGEQVSIRTRDGKFSAYVAKPTGGKGPGLLVIQEIFGVNKVMRDICDAYAAQGYIAMCPDIFWRQEPGVDITDQSKAEWEKAFSLYKGFDEANGVADLQTAMVQLRIMDGCNGKVGVTGYCLGGKLTYLMACRSDCDAAAAYYGVGIDAALDEARYIRNPTILHIAEKDAFVPPEAQKKIREGLQNVPKATVYTYPDDDHAFCRVGGQHYNAESCRLANGRTMELFRRTLA
jgi:carboxymethylenebutenolidase